MDAHWEGAPNIPMTTNLPLFTDDYPLESPQPPTWISDAYGTYQVTVRDYALPVTVSPFTIKYQNVIANSIAQAVEKAIEHFNAGRAGTVPPAIVVKAEQLEEEINWDELGWSENCDEF